VVAVHRQRVMILQGVWMKSKAAIVEDEIVKFIIYLLLLALFFTVVYFTVKRFI